MDRLSVPQTRKNPRSMFLRKGPPSVLWKVPRSLEGNGFMLRPGGRRELSDWQPCFLPCAPPAGSPSRKHSCPLNTNQVISLSPISPLPLKPPQDRQHLPQTPSCDGAYLSDSTVPSRPCPPGSNHTCFLAASQMCQDQSLLRGFALAVLST